MVQVAELDVPESKHDEVGLNIPVLLDVMVTVPVGVSVPGAISDTVTVHDVGTPTVTDEPHTIPVVVEIGLTVNGSQLLVTALLFASPP